MTKFILFLLTYGDRTISCDAVCNWKDKEKY